MNSRVKLVVFEMMAANDRL